MRIWSWTVDDWNAFFQGFAILCILGTLLAGAGKFWTDRIIKARAAQESAAAKASAAKVQADLDTQRERTTKAEEDILEVQAKFRRRTLTQSERNNIVGLLHAYLTIAKEAKEKYGESFMIVYPSDEGDPARFANLLHQLFFQAGWSVQIHPVPYAEHVIGISIVVRDPEHPPKYAQVLQKALPELRLPVSVREEKGMEDKSTILEVGSLF
jgi:hypothetical protein